MQDMGKIWTLTDQHTNGPRAMEQEEKDLNVCLRELKHTFYHIRSIDELRQVLAGPIPDIVQRIQTARESGTTEIPFPSDLVAMVRSFFAKQAILIP